MGRRSPEDTILHVQLPRDLKAEIDQLAEKELSPTAVVVRRALLRELARAKEADRG
jgi:predicted transcriptional regulator